MKFTENTQKTIPQTTSYSLSTSQWPPPSGLHEREAPVHGAVPAPLLLLQDPGAQTRLPSPLRPLTRPNAHHSGQELPGEGSGVSRFCFLSCASVFSIVSLSCWVLCYHTPHVSQDLNHTL